MFTLFLSLSMIFFVSSMHSLASNTPTAPQLNLEVSQSIVKLSWNASSNAEGYVLYFAPYPDASYIGSIDIGNLTQVQFSVFNNHFSFYVAVRAQNSFGLSDFSNVDYFWLPGPSADITGVWDVQSMVNGEARKGVAYMFMSKNGVIKGDAKLMTLTGFPSITGTLMGNQFEIILKDESNSMVATGTLNSDGTEATGTFILPGLQNPVIWSGKKRSEIKELKANGTYTISEDNTLTMNFLASEFTEASQPSLTYKISSITNSTLTLLNEYDLENIWIREKGTSSDLIGTWKRFDGESMIKQTFTSDGEFEFVQYTYTVK